MHTLQELQDLLKLKVIGQDNSVQDVSIAFYKYLLKAHARDLGLSLNTSTTILLQGDSGTGKTFLIRTLADIINVPMYEINAKSICQEGWNGNSFLKLLEDCMKIDNSSIKGGIIFIDEVDKMITPLASDGNSNYNETIQASILKYVEGMEVMLNRQVYNTSNFMFVFAGAFTDLDLNVKQDIGFDGKITEQSFEEALLNYGLLPELAGRIQTFTRLNSLNKQQYIDILNNSYGNLKFWTDVLQKLNIKLEVNLDNLVECALQSNLGVRGLIQAVEREVTTTMQSQVDECNIEKFSPLYIKPSIKP